ncbi:hypothetical protein [Sediminibacterium soli]|uniref:hypothetical protein n=1 Tax=Sediminibacterium soli TaxID=2698829 RepID=UPI00137A7ACD|nr:hypothetical protein [Sediminibacterium soli]NCI46752.1 hypothetical protein [Sediminibacterium soli]
MNYLDNAIADLPFSEEMKTACLQNHVLTLRQLLSLPIEQVIQDTWLTMPMLEELQQFVKNSAIIVPGMNGEQKNGNE